MPSSRNGQHVTPKTTRKLPFEQIWLVDFEFIPQPGERPDVVCLTARELRSRQTIALRRDELGSQPPYRTDDKVVFVRFVANAEVACHLSLNWPAPKNIIDLGPVFRNIVNGRSVAEGKGLLGALRYYDLDAISPKQKDAMRDRIMRVWPFTNEEWVQILAYCVSDIDALERLLPHVLAEPEFDLDVALYHGEFVAASALMEYHGVPIGPMPEFKSLTDKRAWSAIRDAMVPAIDANYGVYVRGVDGDWHFNMERFHSYLEREGITGWPLLATDKLDMRRKTFDAMSKA
jgi:DNA polymerase I